MLKKITTIALAMMTGFVEPVQIFAEEQTQATPVPTEEASSDLEGGISQGYPTPAPEEDTTATDETTDVSPDTTPDANDENADENVGENAEEPTEGDESKAKASFKEGVEQQEDGTFVWNVDTEEKEHTFAYRVELSKLDQAQVKVLVPSTVFRDGEEGYFIASDLEADNSKLHLKVYEIQTSEDGTETKLEVKNEPQKEAPTDGVNAIAEANGVLQDPTLEPGQGTLFPDTSVSEDEEGSEDTDEGEKTEVKYSTNYVSQLAEESGVLEIKACAEAPLETSVIQVEYTVEKGIYGNVCPQVFTAIADIGDENSDEFVECESNELEFVKNDGGKELKKNDNVGTVKDKVTDNSATTYTVTYNAGDGQFDGGSKTNVIKFNVVSNPVTKYSHTSNLSDDGIKNSNYGNSEKKTEIVTIPGADQLTVTVTYGGESKRYDWLSIFSGNHPDYTAASDYSKADIAQKLGGGTHTDASNTVTYTVQGDSVTFAWKTDSSGCGEGYGYYAKIAGSGRTMSGTYKRPTPPAKKKLDGWATAKGGAIAYPKTGIPGTAKIASNLTLYAVYSDFEWQDDWEYTLNNTNHTILLKKYNGEETTYTIPSSAKIDGATYTTTIGRWSYDYTLAHLDTGTITSLSFQTGIKIYDNSLLNLFYKMQNLKTINFSNFDTSNVTSMYGMFDGCKNLTSLDVSHFNTNKVTNMNDMFNGCSSLTTLDVSNFNTSNVTNMNSMFNGCSSLTTLDVSRFNTSNVKYMYGVFCFCSNLTSLNLSNFGTSKVTDMSNMFSYCSKLTALDLSHFDTSKVTNMSSMFFDCSGLTTLDVSNFDTRDVTNMSSMFYGCKSLTTLDVSNVATSKVTNMNGMFYDCSSLTTLDASHFNTGNVTNMSYMFYDCKSLTSLDVSNFNTSNATAMNAMFYGCSSLTTLDASNFNTNKVTDMRNMFCICSNLTSLNLSNFDTSKVTNMSNMFALCSSLTELEIGPSMKFLDNSKINDTNYGTYTGKWKLNNTGTAIDLITQYDGSKPGRYYRETTVPNYQYISAEVCKGSGTVTLEAYGNNDAVSSKSKAIYTGANLTTNSWIALSVKPDDGYYFDHAYIDNVNTYYSSPDNYYKYATHPGTYTGSDTFLCVPNKTPSINDSNASHWQVFFETSEYRISCDANGGTVGSYPTTYTIESGKITLPTPTRANYTFTGWTGSNGTTPQKTVTIPAGSTGHKSYKANWAPTNYTITYNLNGGSISGQKTSYNVETADFTLPTPSKTGYTFTGWTGSNGSTAQTAVKIAKGSTGNKSYTANWKAKTYTVTYNGNGATSGSMSAGTAIYGKDYTTKANAFARKGYTFAGWNEKADGTGTSWTKWIGKPWNWSYTKNITLYAQWTSNTYTYNIKYVSKSGASLGTSTVSGTFGSSKNVTAPAKTGYSTPVAQNAAFDSVNAKTITFTYTPIDYKITYDLAGGSISGQKTSYNIETADFTLPTPSKTGYTFTGWTGSNGSTAQTTVKIAKGSTGNKSYTANWSVNSYYVDLNGWLDGASSGNISNFGTADVYINGTQVANDVADYYTKHPYGTKYEIKDIKTKAGHVYNGVHNGSLSGTVGTGDTKVALDFSTKKTTVNFYRNYNTSDATKSSEAYTYGKTGQAFSNRGYSRTGYTLIGWAHSQTATSADYSVNCGVADSWIDGKYPSTNLYAVWKKDTYSISYNLNGGSVSGNPTSYQVDSADITLKNPTKTGYQFAGWTGSNGSTAQTTVKIAKGSTGNKSYTANWKANTVYIAYGVNGGTVSSSTYSVNQYGYVQNASNNPWFHSIQYGNKDDMYNASTLGLTKNGYSFAYWQNEKTGTKYQQDDVYESTSFYGENTSQTTANTADVRCYVKAIWTPIDYAITYDLADGSISGQKTSYNIETANFTLPTPVRKGYTFAGWTGTGLSFATKSVTVAKGSTGARSYTATWTKDTYTISYNLNGGSVTGNPTSYQVDTADITLKNPSKTGYSFAGWTGSNGSTAQTTVKIAKGSTGNKSYTANWSANTYTYNIKYVSKSGVALGTATVSGAYGSSKNVTAPVKTGYSTPVAQNVAFNSVNAKTITFTYTPVDYAITYNLAGGSISGQKTSYNIETANFTLPTPTRSGYTFAGWTGTGLSSATKTVTVTKGTTGARSYTATWTPTNYTITYNLNGGSISGQKTSYNIETADFTLPTPSKTGHTFTGWTGTGLSSATKTVTVAKGSTGNRSYTANWSINKYDIILKGDAGTESVTYGGKTYPLDATHSVTIRAIYNTNTAVTYKVKPKYHIVSETGTSMSNTDSSWSNNIGKEGSTGGQTWTTCAFTRTITIKTASNQFTVAFNANTGTGTMNNQVVTNNANQKVNSNAFKKAGYTFKSWNTSTDGTGTTYANSATVDSIAANNGATVTLYAQWAKDTYTISYSLNGGSVSGNPTSYQVDTADITLKSPSKTGYSFAGWTGSNGTTAQTAVKIAKGSTGNKSYTANWKANTYTYNIKYVSKSGVALGTATVSGTYGSSKNVTAPAKAGYSTPVAQNVAFNSVNAKTITFTYTPIDYTITYDVNGGNSLSGQRTTYNVESSAYTLPTPTRAGHDFTGWTGSNGTTTQTSVVLAKGTTGNKSYKANWKAKTYTVTYNSNCTTSSGTMATDTVTYGTDYTAKANGFTRPGYKFAGWTENADGTGSNWTNWIGKPWNWTYTRSITLYAQWTPNKLTINYHNDGAQKWQQYPNDTDIDVTNKDVVQTETVNYDGTYDHADAGLLDVNRFTKTGYHTGEAWKVGSKTSTTKVSDGDNTFETTKGQSVAKYLGQDLSKGDVTVDLYPVFIANTYTIKYDGNGANGGSTASSTHTYDTAKSLTANGYTRTDYAFTGWNTEKNGSGTFYTDKASVKNLISTNGGTITLYAQWKSVTATLSRTNWQDIYDKTITSFEKGTKTVAEAAATAGAVRIDDGTGAPVWAYKEGTKLYYVANVSKIFMPADSSYWFAYKEDGEYVNTAITSIDLSVMDTSKVTNMSNMFNQCKNLLSLDVSKFNTSNVVYMTSMFSKCSKLTSLDLSNFDTSKVNDMNSMFANCSSLTILNISKFNTSNVEKMAAMFSGCSKLTALDVSKFSTGNVQDMFCMFYNCSSLTSLNVSGFDTKKVVNMCTMFGGCSKLTSLDVSNFNTSNVENMNSMFEGCSGLTSLDVSNFDTSKVTGMGWMFENCSKLTSLNTSNFSTGNVTNMISMFENCNALTSLDISSFDTSKVTNMNSMLSGDNKLISLKLGSKFSFKGDAKLPEAAKGISKGYTHKWTLNDPYNYAMARTNTELMNTYNGATDAGTWVWEKQTSSLKISNKVNGNMGSKTKSFSTTLSMPTMAGKTVDAVFIDNSGTSTTKSITFDKSGKAVFTLTGTSSVTVNKLIPGDAYTVSQSNESKDGYKQISSGTTGTIKADSIAQCSFTNTKGSTLPTGIEAWGTGAVIALIGALMLVVYWLVHKH